MPLASMSKATSICGMPRGAGGMPVELELAERLVVLGHLALALQDVDLDRGLVVLGRREHLALARGNRRVALDQLGHHAALGLDAQGQRRHVQQKHVLDVAREHARLDRGAHGDDLVGVDAPVGLLAGELFDLLLDGGHARHAADEHDVLDLGDALVFGVVDRLAHRRHDTIEQRAREFGQLRARQPGVEVLGT